MNKRDFYKELMSEYMFDKEKICANAKKGKLTGRRPLPIYIGMTAAVAAAVVIVGTAVFTNLGKNNGVQISSNTAISALDQNQRLQRALAEIKRNEGSEKRIDVFITFRTPLAPKTAQTLLSQFSDNSPVKMLHMSDGSKAMGTSEAAAIFRSNSGEVIAAVINCSGYKLAQINSNENVVLAEPVSEYDNIADIKPMTPDITPPDTSSVTSVPEPSKPVVTDPDNSGSNNTHEQPGIDDPSGDLPGGDDPDDPNSGSTSGDQNNSSGTSEPNIPETPGGSSEPNVPNTSDPDPITPPEQTDPSETVSGLPKGTKLPYNSESTAFITDDLGAQKAYFLSDDVFYVKSENAVSLYKWDGKRETLAATQTITDAKAVWVSENGLRMMISGTENGVRRKLFIIDAKNCTINDMNVDEAVGEGSIAEAAYNEKLDIFALNVFDADSRYIYTAKLLGYQISEPQIVAYGSESLSLLAAHGKAVYYSESMGTSTVIFKYEDDQNIEVKVLNSLYVSSLNSAFTHSLVVGTNGLSVFDPAVEDLIPTNGDKISFGASAHSFSDGKSFFTVRSGAIVPESGISEIAKIDFTRSFSAKWAAAVSNGAVRIIPSVYTERVKNDGITFARPEENASAQQRTAVNNAIGVMNALANGSCKECGLNTSEKLIAAIDACFSESEARYIKARCEVSESGALSYTSGGFTAVNVSDTVLVMDNELNGTLYIKAGTFDGKTAYRTVAVILTEKNGRLLMDAAV